jgi:hypothetical protein
VNEIEKRVDRAIAQPIAVNAELGGLSLETLGEVMEFAKLMAVSGAAVPKYLRGNPGACLAITTRALRWRMDPFAVAEKSYMVVNKGEERVAFEAQLVHAVITALAPLKGRLRYEIIGDGDDRRCKVWGTFRGETEPHVYTSETLAKLRDARGRNEYGNIKGSPLWDAQPEVQLAYSSVRQWCRLFSSETLLGVYTPDELEHSTPIDVTPPVSALAQRLRDAKQAHAGADRGFDADHVQREARSAIIEGDAKTGDAIKETDDEGAEGSDSQSVDQGGRDDVTGRDSSGGDEVGRDAAVGSDQVDGSQPAGSGSEGSDDAQGEVFPPDRKPQPRKGRKR